MAWGSQHVSTEVDHFSPSVGLGRHEKVLYPLYLKARTRALNSFNPDLFPGRSKSPVTLLRVLLLRIGHASLAGRGVRPPNLWRVFWRVKTRGGQSYSVNASTLIKIIETLE